ncbi:retrovirus-related pol polyprotein from transposon TNT 1-94, partial [Tanacetum coccineum]
MEAEVDQHAIDKKCDEIERKNILIENEYLIANCLSKDVFYTATAYVLTVPRFFDLHEAFNAAQKSIAELESKNSNLKNKIQNDDHDAQIRGKMTCVTMPAEKPKVLAPGVKGATAASGSKPRSNTKKDRTLPAKSDMKKVEVVQIILWYLDSGYSKHMTGDRSRLMNFVKKFIGTVRFGNDHFGAIMGYGDYMIGDSMISRVYYVEGLGHNLFSVEQFCNSDLKVVFRKHSCFVRDVNGVDLTKGTRGSNLYTISIEDMLRSSLICLLSKASKNKSWLWHHRLNHLNFGTINDLARKDLVRGFPRLKFEKDHLCSACQLRKSQKYSHKPKSENTNLEVLHTLHMDLCGPMRVQTINGKKYILVIVDDYSRSPQQNGVVESRNHTLVEAAQTMLIFSKAPMFLWAEAVATACYTQNRSLIHTRHNKTPYELMHDKKP